jgi:hypothetical protein
MTTNEFRKLALGLPETVESSHMGHPDFRVRKRIFASLGYPGPGWGVVKLTSIQQEWFTREQPEAFVPVKGEWGNRGYTGVKLSLARKAVVREALETAWRNCAPKRLAARLTDA